MTTIDAEAATTATRGRRWPRDSRMGSLAIMAVVAVVIFGVAMAVNQPSATTTEGLTQVSLSGPVTGEAPRVGAPAPDFAATTVDGTAVTLSDFRGTPVWLTFGASWCQPCRAENPDVQAAYDTYRARGLVVLAIFISEDAVAVRDYATRVGLTYSKVADPDTRIASAYRILGIPSHFFIDSSGVLRKVKVGSLDPAAMEAALAEIMK